MGRGKHKQAKPTNRKSRWLGHPPQGAAPKPTSFFHPPPPPLPHSPPPPPSVPSVHRVMSRPAQRRLVQRARHRGLHLHHLAGLRELAPASGLSLGGFALLGGGREVQKTLPSPHLPTHKRQQGAALGAAKKVVWLVLSGT